MNTNHQILNYNLACLNEWTKRNESLVGNLQIVGPNLICQFPTHQEAIDVSNFSFDSLLENELLREHIQDPKKINAIDLFQIIRTNILAESYLNEMNVNEHTQTLFITNLEMKVDDNQKYFLVMEDNHGHKFKINQNIDKALQIYQKLSKQQMPVDFSKFKAEMDGIVHE